MFNKLINWAVTSWNAESTKLGKLLHTWIAGILALCAILGGLNEYLAVLPPDFVPQWVKTMVVISGIVAFVGGKLTKAAPVQPKP